MPSTQELFKEGDTSLGIFYPTHYIVAGYPTLADAEAAAMACRKNGFKHEDVHALEGKLAIEQVEAREGANWIERMQQRVAELVGTEAGYVREDADFANSGGAFLFVYAPQDDHVETARRVFAQHGPAFARRYLNLAVQNIVRNPEAP